jgi:hypothetical protein
VVGVSALVNARYDRYEDSAVEKHLLQWLELVQVGSLDSAALVSFDLIQSDSSFTRSATASRFPNTSPSPPRPHARPI